MGICNCLDASLFRGCKSWDDRHTLCAQSLELFRNFCWLQIYDHLRCDHLHIALAILWESAVRNRPPWRTKRMFEARIRVYNTGATPQLYHSTAIGDPDFEPDDEVPTDV
jgi:hypothetical protein